MFVSERGAPFSVSGFRRVIERAGQDRSPSAVRAPGAGTRPLVQAGAAQAPTGSDGRETIIGRVPTQPGSGFDARWRGCGSLKRANTDEDKTGGH